MAAIPPVSAARSVSARMRSLSRAVNVRRRGRANNSGDAEAGAATTVGLNLDSIAGVESEEQAFDSVRLQRALGELSPDFRLVLLMFYFEDCSYREIAEKLDLPIGTVMSRLARAKGHLRAKLFETEPLRAESASAR